MRYINIIAFITFFNCLNASAQNLSVFTVNVDVCKKSFNRFYTCVKPIPTSLNPIIISEKYILPQGVYQTTGIVYKNNKPISNIEIYSCRKLRHFGKNTILWDSEFKINRKIGVNDVPFYSLKGNNIYDQEGLPVPYNLDCNVKNDSAVIWCDTTGIFSINYDMYEWLIFWDPVSKEGVLIYSY